MHQIDLEKDFGIIFKKRKPKEWTQDYVPVKKIINGVIVTEDSKEKHHYIKVLEIEAVNFAIMSPEEQDRLILTYTRFLRTGPSNFQIKVVTKRTNIEEYIRAAIESLKEEKNPNCKKLIQNYIAYLKREAGMQTFKKHYYLIFEYEPPMHERPASSEGEIIAALNEKAKEISEGLRSIGNKVIIRQEKEETIKLCNLIYDYYNRFVCREQTFKDRLKRIVNDTKIINNLSEYDNLPDADFKTLLAPKGIDFNESPNYMIMGGQYRSHFFIPGHGIPNVVNTCGGWLTEIMSLGEGFDVDFFYKKESSTQKLNSIRNSLKFSKYRLETTEVEEQNADEVAEGYSAAMFMKKALSSGGEEIFEMSILLTTYADTFEELKERKAFIKRRSVEMDIPILECKRFQEEAFESTGYFLNLTPKMFNLTHRNITTSGVAASYPYTSFALNDPEGIAIGYNRENRSLIMLDPFAPHLANSNISLYGASGHGKTFALLTLTTRLRYQGIQNYILTPEKQDEFRRICDALGGVFIDISPVSNQRINLFEIRPMESPEMEFLGGVSYTEKSWLIDKIDNIKIWCSYLINDLSYAEKVTIGNILMNLYRDFGITSDNDTIYADKSLKIIKRMPIMSDFYERVKQDTSLRPDIATILSQFVTGAAKSMNGQTNVDLDNKYIVFGLENIKGELLAPSMFIILDYVWGKSREKKTEKKMISIDEGWKLLDRKNPLVGEFVQDIFKLIRGYGGGALFATQSIVDLYSDGGNFGNAILSNSHSKIILGMEQKDLRMLKDELGLSPTEVSQIIGADVGEALLCAGSNHIPVKIEASDLEYRLFTTKRSDLKKMFEEAMN